MMNLKGPLSLNLWFHLGVPAKSVVILQEQNYIVLKEQWAHLDVGVNVVESVNTSLKLILLLVVSLEKYTKLIIV